MKWTVAQSGWVWASHTLVIAVGRTQRSNDVIQSQHAPAVPEYTSPAVPSKAMVKTHLNTHTPTRSCACSAGMHSLTFAHKHTLTQSHYCEYTPKHTHHPTHKHSVSRAFGIAVCELPSLQGKVWPFTSSLVFTCTNCWVVQVYLGADVWKHTLSVSVSE